MLNFSHFDQALQLLLQCVLEAVESISSICTFPASVEQLFAGKIFKYCKIFNTLGDAAKCLDILTSNDRERGI